MKHLAALCSAPVVLLISSIACAAAPSAMLRVVCEDGDKGAEVMVDGKFKGECPVDIMLTEGSHKLRVSKPAGATQEQLFEQDVRLGGGTSKRIDVVLSAPQMNAAARRAADAAVKERQRKAEAALVKLIQSAPADPKAAKDLARFYFRDARSCYLFMPIPSDSVSWTGPCRDGIASGSGELKFETNGVVTMRYVGMLAAGWADGQGTAYFKDGEQYAGDFAEGFRHGHGKQLLANGTFEGEFVKGLRNGRGVYVWNTGDRYDGNWVDGKREGKGDVLTKDGYRYIGDFANNMRHGNGVVIAPDGTRVEGRFENDERVGAPR
ncbi:PEGA domain-containing protein [Herbaspirillum rhizosphaerae]|uniref:PEGA domain-containing protein n=1 Tax=Herbaspirillum rhizosphaerae TaxID=346179 RepID=UPI0009F96ADB|nr:PEGA domain-containing protein [Herbaspirillum rhizosphaerae]